MKSNSDSNNNIILQLGDLIKIISPIIPNIMKIVI